MARVRGSHYFSLGDGALKDHDFVLKARIQATRGVDDSLKPGSFGVLCVSYVCG